MGQALPDGRGLTSANDKVLWRVLLQHEPHAVHIVARMAPVAFGIQITQQQALLCVRTMSG